MTIQRALPFVLLLAGCGPTSSEVRPHVACNIPEMTWPADATTFDKARTALIASRLEAAATADRDQLKSDPRAVVGARLDAVARETSDSTAFIAKDVADLGIRLRQLECAIARGTFASDPTRADKLYAQILTELKSARERAQ